MNSDSAKSALRPAGAAVGTFLAGMLFLLPIVTGVAAQAPGAAGDAANGKALFEKRCTGCHSLDRNMEGPRLRDVYGRAAGSVSEFQYSSALKSAHVTWDLPSLDKWLTDPESFIPGDDMAFHVPKAEERKDIIAYLRATAGR